MLAYDDIVNIDRRTCTPTPTTVDAPPGDAEALRRELELVLAEWAKDRADIRRLLSGYLGYEEVETQRFMGRGGSEVVIR